MNKAIQAWADKLLDTGNRNNLVNFKDRKGTTIEIISDEPSELFDSLAHGKEFSVFDPKKWFESHSDEEQVFPKTMNKEEFCASYEPHLQKKEVLLYNQYDANSVRIVKNLDQRFSSAIEETGVNIGHMFFGQVEWKNGNTVCNAPLLLLPVEFYRVNKNDPYTLRSVDDDIVVNPTFNYKMKAEFGAELPEYDEEEGLLSYLLKVDGIVKKLGWSTSPCCKIGPFSFLKINMYKDLLENEAKIIENPNVQCLLGMETHDPATTGDADFGEDFNELVDIHNVVDADSSQLEAIKLAKAGKSFVLQGPPGTGKSQTIANIIAECLLDDKKVLFVSEKQAALNVVFEKMKQVGLSDFCLELHSHKSNKKDFVLELNRTLKLPLGNIKLNENSQKASQQDQLDDYVDHLHRDQPVIGKSMYNLYNEYLRYKDAMDVDYLVKDISKKDDAHRFKVADAVSHYADYAAKVGVDFKQFSWYGFTNLDSSIQGKSEIKECFSSLIDEINGLLVSVAQLKDKFGVGIELFADIPQWTVFLRNITALKGMVPGVLSEDSLDETRVMSNKVKVLSTELIGLKQFIDESYESDVYGLDGADLSKRLKLFDGFFARLFSKEYRQIKNSIKMCAKHGVKLGYENVCLLAQSLSNYQKKIKEFESLDPMAKECLGLAYAGHKTNWDSLEQKLRAVPLCLENKAGCELVRTYSQNLFDEACEKFASFADILDQFVEKTGDLYQKLDNWFEKSVLDSRNLSFDKVVSKLSRCLADLDRLETWKLLKSVLNEIESLGETDYLNFCLSSKVPLDKMKDAYNKRFYSLWIDYVKNNDDVLGFLDRVAHTSVVDQFTEADRSDLTENRKRIKKHLVEQKLSYGCIIPGSGIGIIAREAEKQRKIKPVRRLISEVGETIQAIKPCFLMSPLSVSTFIPSQSITFDTVIFDEASQVFPQDAIGAIYRGKQIIVVGDSKQMPPTNFFSADLDASDEDDYDDLTDYESILDLCSTSFKQQSLLWHYRSRYEQLIAFSNHNFYDGRLISFPSAAIDREGIGVDYYHVDGCFEHKSRYNVPEAERVVDLILEHVKKYPNRSLGVVAFNMSQQSLIEQLLEKRVGDSDQYGILYDKSLVEPFFIKNLESVQGDERDTIIFSTTYGYDSAGKMLHNFGPLSRKGGERRLNVAVSRARINVQVVSSMHGFNFDLSRTSARGAQLLKQYLDFAEKGPSALASAITVKSEDAFDSLFEMEVCEFLRSQGYTVDSQVGCSGFRIDLGIRKPDSSEYFLAVECDGASYHSSKNARDRDRLRQEILERMGWNFYRVWSTDWFRHEGDEKKSLLAAVRAAEERGARIVEKPIERVETPPVEPEVSDSGETEGKFELSFEEFHYNKNVKFGSKYTLDLAENIKAILATEMAVSKESLLDRIVEVQYNRQRATKVVEKEFNSDIHACLHFGIEERNGFLFLEGVKEIPLRVPGDRRPIDEISLEELSSGLFELIKVAFSIDKMSLFKQLCTLLGFERLGPNIQERFCAALGLLGDKVTFSDERIILRT